MYTYCFIDTFNYLTNSFNIRMKLKIKKIIKLIKNYIFVLYIGIINNGKKKVEEI